MKIALLLILQLAVYSFSEAKPVLSIDDHQRLSKQTRDVHLMARPHRPAALKQGIFQQNIDHFGQVPGQTFHQRYWIDSEFARNPESAPVIFHICGEGNAEDGYFLDDNAIAWAQALGAHLVYLEHRYYGQSLPFADLTTDHLQFLTLGNVIEDLATFQQWLSAANSWNGKWISVGGSYSGTLSAIYRLKHPELDSGALASSAPMISGQDQTTDQGGFEDISDPSNDSGDRQWAFQACTTFGFWEADGPTMDSTIYDPSAWLCHEAFGNVTLVDSDSYNQNYYFPFISNTSGAASNILFTYGSEDVWTKIGVAQQTNKNPYITIRIIQGAGHHFDLNPPDPSDSTEVVSARNAFLSLAQKWLNVSL